VGCSYATLIRIESSAINTTLFAGSLMFCIVETETGDCSYYHPNITAIRVEAEKWMEILFRRLFGRVPIPIPSIERMCWGLVRIAEHT
jgi:hypothetical protein